MELKAYKKCRDCGFWVTSEEMYCRNCGIIYPLSDKRPRSDTKNPYTSTNITLCKTISAIIGLVVGGIVGGILPWYLIGGKTGNSALFILFGVVAASAGAYVAYDSIIGTFVGTLIQTIRDRITQFTEMQRHRSIKRLTQRSEDCLQHYERRIHKSLKDLDAQERHLLEIKQQILQRSPGEQLKLPVASLEEFIHRFHLLKMFEKVKRWKIEQECWINRLIPIMVKWPPLETEYQYQKLLEDFETVQHAGEKMLSHWKQQADLAATEDGKIYIREVQEILESCNDLIEGLLAGKARLAVQGISLVEPVSPQQIEDESLKPIREQIRISIINKSFFQQFPQFMFQKHQKQDRVASNIGK